MSPNRPSASVVPTNPRAGVACVLAMYTVTTYEGDDPTCTPHTYSVGQGFVDEGGDHVHIIRNEGLVEARTVAVQVLPAGAARRTDKAGSPDCPF